MEKVMKCKVLFAWDEESSVWIATSEDVQGLVLESESYESLLEKVRHAVPELLRLNQQLPSIIDYTFVSKCRDKVPLYG